MYKAPFITFEGGEGSGKSTQIEILFKKLLQSEVDVVSYREPGGTKGAEEIRHLLMEGDGDRWTSRTEALLMSAARADLVQKRIIPQLEGGTWVLCDRFADSTIAYQGYGHKLGKEQIESLNLFTIEDLKPSLTFVFQISAELGLQRAALRRTGIDRFHRYDLDFHQRVEKGYEDILMNTPDRCVGINALLDIDMISKQIFDEVRKRFDI